MNEIIRIISDIMLKFAQFWAVFIAIAIIVIAGIYLFLIDKRHPKIRFLAYDKGTFVDIERRLIGNMVVKANILDLLFIKDKLFGPRIEDYDYVRKGNQKIYLAKIGAGGTLIPLKINEQRHSLDEISAISAKTLAMEYINCMDEVKERIEKANPFWTALIGTLPLAIVLVLVFAIFWAFTTFTLDVMKEIMQPLQTIIEKYEGGNINVTITSSQ